MLAAVLALGLLYQVPAHAETATEDAFARARSHFEAGLRLASTEKDWNKALEEFAKSRAIFPTRSATLNMAVALQELTRYAEALQTYEALLSEFGALMPSEQRQAAERERDRLKLRVGKLELLGGEPGTSVALDGRTLGTIPLPQVVWLNEGPHTVHLAKEGRLLLDQEIRVVAGKTTTLNANLRSLEGSGVLVIREKLGEDLQVVVDAVNVGRTPFRGPFSPGRHSVVLRGNGRGTAPIGVVVTPNEITTVTLEAIPLEADVTIQSTPDDATIFIDGVFVGNGTWRGNLPSGNHRFEALGRGYQPFRRDLRLTAGPTRLSVKLVPSEQSSPAASRALSGVFVEGLVGPLMAWSFHGSLADCSCGEYERPRGWHAAFRLGYAPWGLVAAELAGGALSISEAGTRTMKATADTGGAPFVARDYRDETSLSGAFFAAGISVRRPGRFALTTRGSLGLARLRLQSTNWATYEGWVRDAAGAPKQVSAALSVPEPSSTFWTPMLSTELRAGYKLTRRLSVDAGLAVSLLVFRSIYRTNRHPTIPSNVSNERALLDLPTERAVASFLVLAPSVAVRFEF